MLQACPSILIFRSFLDAHDNGLARPVIDYWKYKKLNFHKPFGAAMRFVDCLLLCVRVIPKSCLPWNPIRSGLVLIGHGTSSSWFGLLVGMGIPIMVSSDIGSRYFLVEGWVPFLPPFFIVVLEGGFIIDYQ